MLVVVVRMNGFANDVRRPIELRRVYYIAHCVVVIKSIDQICKIQLVAFYSVLSSSLSACCNMQLKCDCGCVFSLLAECLMLINV